MGSGQSEQVNEETVNLLNDFSTATCFSSLDEFLVALRKLTNTIKAKGRVKVNYVKRNVIKDYTHVSFDPRSTTSGIWFEMPTNGHCTRCMLLPDMLYWAMRFEDIDKQSDEKTTIFADTARALREHHGVIGELIAREAMKHN